jgi:MYXO-CTERM domain-containing protein
VAGTRAADGSSWPVWPAAILLALAVGGGLAWRRRRSTTG